jgi:hypothetical protein
MCKRQVVKYGNDFFSGNRQFLETTVKIVRRGSMACFSLPASQIGLKKWTDGQ